MTLPPSAPATPPKRRSPLFWIAIGAGGLVALLCLCVGGLAVIGSSTPPTPTALTAQVVAIPPSAPATDTPAATSVPTAVPATQTPFVTSTSVFVEASATPVAASDADRYVALAKAGIQLPSTRNALGYGAGEWKALVIQPGDIMLTMPLEPGTTNEQSVRLGKLKIAQAIKALFDGDTKLTQIAALGTLPDSTGAEGQAISIVITREAFTVWDGTAENLGAWRVAGRLK